MMIDCDFVHVYSFDFSNVFDTVRHATLTSKLAQLELPDSIYNWASLLLSVAFRTVSNAFEKSKE